jgi:O-antigen/teichoic acid export membrane protein
VSELPGKRAFFATFATGIATQALTLVSGALAARLLGPEGRGQFAGSQVWPGILGMIALLGINNALSIRAARQREHKGAFERQSIRLGLLLSLAGVVAGWFAMPWLVPADNPELLWLSRLSLVHIPLFVLTSNLMAIDQGCGDFRQFNIARQVLAPVYLLLVVTLWIMGVRDVVWFVLSLLAANLAVLLFRLAVVRWKSNVPPPAPDRAGLFRTGARFWITGIAAVLRDNAERLLLMFLLGPAALGLYVVAGTASGAHLNLTRSLNLIVFARAATLGEGQALNDAARFFRLMGLLNLLLSLGMVAAMPLLIWLIYGAGFSGSVVPAMLLVAAQYFLSQGAVLDEALRARANPFVGLGGMLCGMAVFAAAGWGLSATMGLLGVAIAAIAGQLVYCLWMVVAFRRASGNQPLLPGPADFADLRRLIQGTSAAIRRRLFAQPAA